MHPGILLEHGFKQNSNQYTTLPWFGTKMAQKYAKRDQSTQTGFCCDVKCHILMFSTSEQCQVATFCTCAVVFRKKCHVSGCRGQAGDVYYIKARDHKSHCFSMINHLGCWKNTRRIR